jgi:hypothetical protein
LYYFPPGVLFVGYLYVLERDILERMDEDDQKEGSRYASQGKQCSFEKLGEPKGSDD